MKSRKVIRGILNHCYQRTVEGYVLFYDIFDCLVYFTLFCTISKKFDIKPVALTLMPDHVHNSSVAGRKKELSSFIQEVTCRFAFLNNIECNRTTPLFQHRFGSVPKVGDKAARTNIIYLGNNPVERRICEKAEQYRWNFLAYAVSNHPFSEPLALRKASWGLRNAMKQVKIEYENNRHLNYNFLHRIYYGLDKKERAQLTDFIISLYNVIDYNYAVSLFDSYENMLHAMHCSTGSEHDLNEVFIGKSDSCYSRIGQYLKQRLGLKDIHKLFLRSDQEREELFFEVLKNLAVPGEQLAKYLRIRILREK